MQRDDVGLAEPEESNTNRKKKKGKGKQALRPEEQAYCSRCNPEGDPFINGSQMCGACFREHWEEDEEEDAEPMMSDVQVLDDSAFNEILEADTQPLTQFLEDDGDDGDIDEYPEEADDEHTLCSQDGSRDEEDDSGAEE